MDILLIIIIVILSGGLIFASLALFGLMNAFVSLGTLIFGIPKSDEKKDDK